MRVLRECMPTHQAAQREANQTGQPTVRILIKLSVTGEQRAHRGHAREEERGAEGGAGGYPFVALRSTTCGTSHLRTKLSPRVPLSYKVLECRRRHFILASLPEFYAPRPFRQSAIMIQDV